MEVGLNINRQTLFPIADARDAAPETPAATRSGWAPGAQGIEDLVAVGGEDAISDETLRKDDALGLLVAQAFGIG